MNDKKAANKRKNKVKKQIAACEALVLVRAEGAPIDVAETVWRGNRFYRAVTSGVHLEPEVPRFEMNPKELELYLALLAAEDKFGSISVKHKSAREIVSWFEDHCLMVDLMDKLIEASLKNGTIDQREYDKITADRKTNN